jgi:DNA-directed RNA polymerase specialized sigma24 family protein
VPTCLTPEQIEQVGSLTTLAGRIAHRLTRHKSDRECKHHDRCEEAVSVAYVALCEAVPAYDAARANGMPLETFVAARVEQAVKDAYRRERAKKRGGGMTRVYLDGDDQPIDPNANCRVTVARSWIYRVTAPVGSEDGDLRLDRLFREGIANLPPQLRSVASWYIAGGEGKGVSARSYAQAHGIPLRTAQWQLNKAIRLVQRYVEEKS